MTGDSKSSGLSLSAEVLSVLNAASGATLSSDQLAEISRGNVTAPPIPLCIGSIGYEDRSGNIAFVQFTNGINIHSGDIDNLDDYRGQFRDAVNFGHGIRLIINSAQRRIEFLVIVPCECPCEEE